MSATAQIRFTHCMECFKAIPKALQSTGASECDTCQEKANVTLKHPTRPEQPNLQGHGPQP